MTTLTVSISDDLSQSLQEIAQRAGISSADLARVGLEEWLARPREDFEKVARYVVEKNAELYRRLV